MRSIYTRSWQALVFEVPLTLKAPTHFHARSALGRCQVFVSLLHVPDVLSKAGKYVAVFALHLCRCQSAIDVITSCDRLFCHASPYKLANPPLRVQLKSSVQRSQTTPESESDQPCRVQIVCVKSCAYRAGWRLQPLRESLALASPPLMSSRHHTLEPYGRWHATIYFVL